MSSPRESPLLSDKWAVHFLQIWENILDLPEVSAAIYDPGKQRNTIFNRKLVANILFYLKSRGAYKNDYKTSEMARYLEGDISHPVRAALHEPPPERITAALDKMLNLNKLN